MSDDAPQIVGNETGERKRLHPATLLVRAPQMVRSIINAWPLFVLFIAQGRMAILALAALAIAALSGIGIFLSWLRFSYTIGDGEIRIDSGVFSRKHRVIPFDRVQDVNIEQGLIARALGLAKVRLETGGSASAGAEEGELNAISLAEADSLRDEIRDWRTDHHSVVSAVVDARISGEDISEDTGAAPIFVMSLPRVTTAGLFNFSLALFAVLFGALQYFDNLLPFDPFEPEAWQAYLGEDNPYLIYANGHRILAVMVGLMLVSAVGVISGIVTTLLRDYGFRLERTATGLRRRRGLTTLTDVAIPIKRVQAALIETGLVRKVFGWYALKLQSLASDSGKEADHVVAALAKREEITRILAEVDMHATATDAQGWHKVHPALWWSAAWITVPLAGMAALAALTWDSRAWFAVPVIGWWVIARWRSWSHHRYHFDGVQLEITSGWWRQRHIILPIKNIQTIDIDQGPLLRLRGLVSLEFGVAGSGARIAAIPLDTAYALRERLLP